MKASETIQRNQSKKFILCADDFGISHSVNEGICLLAEKGRISATSVMVVYEDWNQHAKSLISFKEHLDIGLHFTLSDSFPVSPPETIPSILGRNKRFLPIGSLVQRACLGKIKQEEVALELNAQYSRFVDFFNMESDYVDGHHNAHQLPIIRDAVIEFMTRLQTSQKIYTRNTAITLKGIICPKRDLVKTTALAVPGYYFKRKVIKAGIPTNETFGGVYDWRHPEFFEKSFIRSLALTTGRNGIIMSHPGKSDSTLEKRDPFNKGREWELNFFLTQNFLNIMRDHEISICKFE